MYFSILVSVTIKHRKKQFRITSLVTITIIIIMEEIIAKETIIDDGILITITIIITIITITPSGITHHK